MNLTGADTVIFYDIDWNPAIDLQAQDRAHRIGQTREVHIYKLISENTVEENILKKQIHKRKLNAAVIGDGAFTTDFFENFDPREILGLVEDVTPAEVPKLKAHEVEEAMERLEDRDDRVAGRALRRQRRKDEAEFDEKMPASEAEAFSLLLREQLTGVDKFAMRFFECDHRPVPVITLAEKRHDEQCRQLVELFDANVAYQREFRVVVRRGWELAKIKGAALGRERVTGHDQVSRGIKRKRTPEITDHYPRTHSSPRRAKRITHRRGVVGPERVEDEKQFYHECSRHMANMARAKAIAPRQQVADVTHEPVITDRKETWPPLFTNEDVSRIFRKCRSRPAQPAVLRGNGISVEPGRKIRICKKRLPPETLRRFLNQQKQHAAQLKAAAKAAPKPSPSPAAPPITNPPPTTTATRPQVPASSPAAPPRPVSLPTGNHARTSNAPPPSSPWTQIRAPRKSTQQSLLNFQNNDQKRDKKEEDQFGPFGFSELEDRILKLLAQKCYRNWGLVRLRMNAHPRVRGRMRSAAQLKDRWTQLQEGNVKEKHSRMPVDFGTPEMLQIVMKGMELVSHEKKICEDSMRQSIKMDNTSAKNLVKECHKSHDIALKDAKRSAHISHDHKFTPEIIVQLHRVKKSHQAYNQPHQQPKHTKLQTPVGMPTHVSNFYGSQATAPISVSQNRANVSHLPSAAAHHRNPTQAATTPYTMLQAAAYRRPTAVGRQGANSVHHAPRMAATAVNAQPGQLPQATMSGRVVSGGVNWSGTTPHGQRSLRELRKELFAQLLPDDRSRMVAFLRTPDLPEAQKRDYVYRLLNHLKGKNR